MFNVVSTQAPLFIFDLIILFLQVMRTVTISRMSSKFGQIGPRTAELTALELLEKSSSGFIFYWIIFILAESHTMPKRLNEFEFQPALECL